MGGAINLAVRKADGTIWAAEVWTNPLPHLVRSITAAEDPQGPLEEYMPHYQRDAGAMCYPSGYGLVVIDVPTKTLLSMQGYSDLVSILSFYRFMKSDPHGGDADVYEDHLKLHNEGKLILRSQVWPLDDEKGEIAISDRRSTEWPDFDAFLEEAKARVYDYTPRPEGTPYRRSEMILDIAPWTMIHFDEGTGTPAFKAKLEAMGYEFSVSEEKGWADFFRQYEEDQAEDEEEDDATVGA